MLINIHNYPHFTISTMRHDRMDGVISGGGDYGNPLDAVDYSDPVAVKEARNAIIRMEIWGHPILDGVFEDEREAKAVEAFADMVLCQKAAIWQQEHPGLQPAEGLNEDIRRAAQARFIDMLSSQGLELITQACEHVPGGLRYMPNSGIVELDSMLVTVFSYEDAANVLERAGKFSEAAEAWKLGGGHAAVALQLEAREFERYGRYGEAAEEYGKAADAWSVSGLHSEEAGALQHQQFAWTAAGRPELAAESLERVAMAWGAGRNSFMEEHFWETAAEAWEKLGQYGRAMKAWGQCGWETGFAMESEPACQ